MRYAFMSLLLLSCLDKEPETKCDGMEDIKFTEGMGPDKKEDSLFGDKQSDEGCKVQ